VRSLLTTRIVSQFGGKMSRSDQTGTTGFGRYDPARDEYVQSLLRPNHLFCTPFGDCFESVGFRPQHYRSMFGPIFFWGRNFLPAKTFFRRKEKKRKRESKKKEGKKISTNLYSTLQQN
jgi:hypothetical protein